MPKGRMLSKKISKDLEVARLSCKAALLYTWCIPHLDVEGRIEASPEIIKGVVMPYRNDFSLLVIKKCLEEIAQVGDLIIYYGNSHKYMEFNGFSNNQTLNKDREAPSEIPPPTPDELKSNSGLSLSLSLSLNKDKGEAKVKFLDFVFLTNQEYLKLSEQFGESGAQERIKNLNLYIGSKGDKYKSHYHTILNWERRNAKKTEKIYD